MMSRKFLIEFVEIEVPRMTDALQEPPSLPSSHRVGVTI